jgi:hypothetical protein
MAVAGDSPARRDWEEVKLNNMRKLFALAMIVVLSMTVAFAVVSCGKKAEESTPPPAETSGGGTMSADSGMAHSDSGMAAPADTTKKK